MNYGLLMRIQNESEFDDLPAKFRLSSDGLSNLNVNSYDED